MQADLRTLLVGDAALTGLVSTRIYWNSIPQSAASPCVVMFLIDGGEGYSMSGRDGLDRSLVQIDVRAVDPNVAQMWAVRDAIRNVLSGYRGTVGSTDFEVILQQGERQTSEKPDVTLYHRSSTDWEIWSRAAA